MMSSARLIHECNWAVHALESGLYLVSMLRCNRPPLIANPTCRPSTRPHRSMSDDTSPCIISMSVDDSNNTRASTASASATKSNT